jgi:hypothetical protein
MATTTTTSTANKQTASGEDKLYKCLICFGETTRLLCRGMVLRAVCETCVSKGGVADEEASGGRMSMANAGVRHMRGQCIVVDVDAASESKGGRRFMVELESNLGRALESSRQCGWMHMHVREGSDLSVMFESLGSGGEHVPVGVVQALYVVLCFVEAGYGSRTTYETLMARGGVRRLCEVEGYRHAKSRRLESAGLDIQQSWSMPLTVKILGIVRVTIV